MAHLLHLTARDVDDLFFPEWQAYLDWTQRYLAEQQRQQTEQQRR